MSQINEQETVAAVRKIAALGDESVVLQEKANLHRDTANLIGYLSALQAGSDADTPAVQAEVSLLRHLISKRLGI